MSDFQKLAIDYADYEGGLLDEPALVSLVQRLVDLRGLVWRLDGLNARAAALIDAGKVSDPRGTRPCEGPLAPGQQPVLAVMLDFPDHLPADVT